MPGQETILFVDQYANLGGGQRSLLALIRVAREARIPCSVLAPGGGLLQQEVASQFAGEVPFFELPVVAMKKGGKAAGDIFGMLYFTASVLRALLPLRHCGVKYFNGPRAFLAGLIGSQFLGGRWIYHIRIDHSRVEKMLISAILRLGKNSEVVFNSPFLLQAYLKASGLSSAPARCRVIENSLYPPYDDLPFVDRFSSREGPLTIGVFGRICPEKGQDLLVELVRSLPGVSVRLMGVCEPADQDFLNQILADGEGRISFEGFVNDPVKAVNERGIQLSVVPSRWEEAFGLVAVESMAMSCITLVSDRGMLPEIAKKTGAFCFETPRQLINQVAEILAMEPDLRLEKALSQYEAARAHYRFARFASEIKTLITHS